MMSNTKVPKVFQGKNSLLRRYARKNIMHFEEAYTNPDIDPKNVDKAYIIKYLIEYGE